MHPRTVHMRKYPKLFHCLVFGLVASLAGGSLRAAPPGSTFGADFFPNVVLTNQHGEQVHFYTDLLKDKLYLINFIYTRCKDTCPLETAKLKKLQKALGDRVGKDIFFYSISVDAQHDKPEELKKFAAKFGVGPGWQFLAGRKEDVRLIRKKLGMYRDDGKPEKGLNEHNINILFGNDNTSQWIKRSPFEDTEALVRLFTERLSYSLPQYAKAADSSQAPVATAQSEGAELFQSYCESCHSLDTQDGIGPGLAGRIKQRDKIWLKRWIKEPNRLLDEHDLTAEALFYQYNQINMPNLRLTDQQVEKIVNYLEENENLTQ